MRNNIGERNSDKIFRHMTMGMVVCLIALALMLVIQTVSYDLSRGSAVGYQKQQLVSIVDNYITVIDSTKRHIEESWTDMGIAYSEEDVYNEVLGLVREQLHNASYNYGGYIWINEIRDYSGGDNYAVRLVHPGMPETEGIWLSTNTLDAKGDTPYQVELDGVTSNPKGIIYSYYFKEPDSDNVSKKMTYSKLYKEYNWIVSMGVYYNALRGDSILNNSTVQRLMMLGYVLSIGGILSIIIMWLNLYQTRESIFKNEIDNLSTKVYNDPLTGASSRAYGDKYMRGLLRQYRDGATSPLIAIFDIDNFKHVNDVYGHNFGDYVLTHTVQILKEGLRKTDRIIRWGGDEFIIIYDECDKDTAGLTLDKTVRLVRHALFSEGDINAKVTISLGASFFHMEDENIEETIKRIDDALYVAKQKKNGWQFVD
ncbi:MAG: diguanylate cyclase [Pseudobutyrivibrio sp.]|nr:diguanylate cyclase [Pseudobutyrivibrio sp.]